MFPLPTPRHALLIRAWSRATTVNVAATLAAGTLVYLLARPLLALARELLVLLAAGALSWAAGLGAAATLSGLIPLDPVYTSTMFLLLADVQVTGVAIAPPLGEPLRALLPGLFAAPELVASGAWASAVVQPGASVLARGLSEFAAYVVLLVGGLALTRQGLATERELRWIAVTGALLQAHVVVSLAERPVSLGDLEATGLTYGFSVLFTGPAAERPRLSTLLLALPDGLRDGLLVMIAVGLTYVAALVLLFGLRWAWGRTGVGRALARQPIWGRPTEHRRHLFRPSPALSGLAAFAVLISASPLGSLAEASTHYLGETELAETEQVVSGIPELKPGVPLPDSTAVLDGPSLSSTPEATPAPSPSAATPRPPAVASGPTRVSVSGAGYQYRYQVNGQSTVLRGMGYNPMLADRSPEERAARYDRDFAAMRAAGVNTILGWITEEWDQLLLDKAQEYDLGVILPYDLDPSLDWTDAELRDQVERDVVAWVERYKDHPALRMWGPGNEVLHKLVHPSWMKLRGDPVLEARAEAFAAFYVELIDRIHTIDPLHPVVYRDAEDAYLPELRDALNRTGVSRPWFVYGINIYTPRLAEVLEDWPRQGLDAALLISEFGPGGAGPTDRPRGYRELWAMIRAEPEMVIGGAPYVWNTIGPEEVDRIFGLVDEDGRSVDGSLGAIARVYREDLAAQQAAMETEETDCEQVIEVAARTIRDLQAEARVMGFRTATSESVEESMVALPSDSVRPDDLRVEPAVDEPRTPRPDSGGQREWWVTWSPPTRPDEQLSLRLQERGGRLETVYTYYGAGAERAAGSPC